MTQTLPIAQEELAKLFKRHEIDGHRFFKYPDENIEKLIASANEAGQAENFSLSENLFKDAIFLSEASDRKIYSAKIRNELSKVLKIQGKVTDSLKIIQECYELYHDIDDKRGMAVSLCNIGAIKALIGQSEEAMQALKSALDISDKLNDYKLSIHILTNIGFIYCEEKVFDNALFYFREATMKAEENDDLDFLPMALLNEGSTLLDIDNLTDAKERLDLSLKFAKAKNMLDIKSMALDGLGSYYEKRGSFLNALDHYSQARKIAQTIDHAEAELNAVLNLGRVNVAHGDPLEAAGQLHEALRLATVLERPKSRRDAHKHLARLYKQTGQLALALQHFEAFHAEDHALSSAERDKTTRTLMMQFDVERAQTQTRAEREQREQAEQLRARAEELVRERTADLEQAQMEVVGRLAMAAEFRDDATGEHTRRVGLGAALIAQALGLSAQFTETLQIAARLHDVGKIGVPDAILLKAGKLSVVEFEEMKRHTAIGARLLSGGKSEVLNMARQIALTHHERWDGNGYPNGLTGQEIPLVGRIVALADVFDALMHKRPYKAAWDKAEVLAELAKQRGKHFDPELTDAALLVFGSGRYEAALLSPDQQAVLSSISAAPEVGHWELEAMRMQYEQMLEARTRELETARSQAELQVDQLRRAALTDMLTGLYNRRAFSADLLVYADQAQRDGRPLGLISLDLDGLKSVNDSGGHASGDALIVAVGQQLQRYFEPAGRVYRMGGDEFAVLVWNDPETVSRELASEIEHLEAELARQGHLASLSAGYAHWPSDTALPEHLLRRSDERMYEQKRQRKRRTASLQTRRLA